MHDAKEHWEDVWTRKKSNEVSWYQQYPKISIDLILLPILARMLKLLMLVVAIQILWINYLILILRTLQY